VFAGVSLDGTVVQADRSGDHAMYGKNATRRQILDGGFKAPQSAQALVREIDSHSTQARAESH
jgi:lipid-binding SYLF domain-containing protein